MLERRYIQIVDCSAANLFDRVERSILSTTVWPIPIPLAQAMPVGRQGYYQEEGSGALLEHGRDPIVAKVLGHRTR